MHDLLQQLHSRAVSGEHLEVLGKQAAAEWCRGKHKSLTDSVVATVKHAGLSSEQVRRVVEFTNIAAFNQEFRKEAAPHRVVSFSGGPADASFILKDINDSGAVVSYNRGLSDYAGPPPERTKHASPQAEAEFDTMLTKSASADYPVENPFDAAVDTWDKLSAIRDRLTNELGGLEVMFHDVSDRVFNEVKQAALEGTSLGEIMQAWQTVAPDPQYIKIAFAHLTPRLLENRVFSSLTQMNSSLDKTASARLVNPRHPLVMEFGDFCEALSKLAETRATRDVVVEHLAPIQQFLAKVAAAGGVIPEAWKHYKGGVEWLGKNVGTAAEYLAHNKDKPGQVAAGTDKVVQFLGKRVVPVVAAHQVYKNYIEPNPVYQGVTNAVLPSTPGTSQFYGYGY